MQAEHKTETSWGDRDDRPGLEQRILDFATLGDALFQEQVSTAIAYCHKRVVGAVAQLRFVPWSGDGYHLNRQTPRADGVWVDDTDNIDCDDETGAAESVFAKVSFPFKFQLLIGTISRHAIARGRRYADLVALELTDMAKVAMYTLEKATFTGNFDGTTPKEFEGLFALLQDYNGPPSGALPTQVLMPSDAVLGASPAGVGGTLTLALLDELLDQLMVGPGAIFASKAGARVINSLLQAQQQFGPDTMVNAGFTVKTYNGYPILRTDGIPDTLNFDADGDGMPIIDSITGGAETAIVAVNTDEVFYAELTPLTIAPLAQCTSQKQRIDGWWDGTLVLNCPEGAAMIANVNPVVA